MDFDYVIVGAGSAGCVLAERLSAEPTLRVLLLLVVFALSAVILVSTIGATVKDVQLHGLVYVFFALDVLLALLIVFSFGRRDRRRVRRRASPAKR